VDRYELAQLCKVNQKMHTLSN